MFFSTNSSTKNGHEHDPFLKHQDFHLPISFFPFPSPFEVDDQFHDEDLFFQQLPHKIIPAPPHNPEINSNSTAPMARISNSDNDHQMKKMVVKKAPRKRLCKKDRHSKICTARGQRDRRMRLSLPVARQFFGLQDMLGVDKGSKTVEWLLLQARPEILKLAKERNCSSSSLGLTLDRPKSVCSSTSEIDDHDDPNEKKLVVKKVKSVGKDQVVKKRVKKPIRKMMAKEMRKKARERARERARARTIEKNNQIMQIKDSVISDFDPNYTKIITPSISCFETGEESGATTQISYNFNPPAMEVEDQPMSCSQFVSDNHYQNSLEIMGNWSPSASNFNFLHHTSTLDLQDQQNEFGDSQFFG